MPTFLAWLFDTSMFTPHGFCLLWRPDLVWTTVIADTIIAASYFSIPVALGYFVMKRSDLAFPWIFALFGAFILLCGGTHVMEAVTFWRPLYGLEAFLKGAAALVSLVTAIALWPLMPRALALPGFGDLRRLNDELEREVTERRRAELALRDANTALERRIAERTSSLTSLTEDLQAEIAERQRIEQGLRATTGLLRATFEAAPFPVAVAAPDTTVMMWNRAAEEVFGFASDWIIGRPYREIVTDEDRTPFDALFARALSGANLRGLQTRHHARDGRPLDISCSSAPVREPDGRIMAVAFVLEDVTQRNATEAQLRQAQKMEAIGNLTGGMAHDFNNLLGVVIGNLDSLEGDVAADPRNSGVIRDALEAALRGAELTRHLLAFARRQPLRPERIDLNIHVGQTLALLRRTLREDIVFETKLDPAAWPVLADSAQLQSAIANLATNARDAMPKGGKLIVTTAKAYLDAQYAELHPEVLVGDYALIEVSDTGIGMTPEIAARVFEPFFTTKEEGKGSGLGLAMVFGFIKQTGGHINVYSELGKGTCFRIYLPRAIDADQPATAPTEPADELHAGHEAVLVVEDNDQMRRIVVRQLNRLGYRVHAARNAAEALDQLGRGAAIDLLFTDIVMPGELNGTDLARAATALAPGIKVLFTSGYPDAHAEAGGWIAGDGRLLTKPYRKEELARVLREVLDA